MRELYVQSRIRYTLRKMYPGAGIFKLSDYSISGLPDLLFVYSRKAMFIEVKTPRGRLSKIQEETINLIRRNGIPVKVARSKDEAITFVKSEIERR